MFDHADNTKNRITESINNTILSLKDINMIDLEKISDGYHTFEDLYLQRVYLTAALLNTWPELSYKTRHHSDGTKCFGGGWFLVEINTPDGPYSYHYEDKYWDLFRIPVRDKAHRWDGHTSKDVVRLNSLPSEKAIFYLCDRANPCCDACSDDCSHTRDIQHAKNFKRAADGSHWEEIER